MWPTLCGTLAVIIPIPLEDKVKLAKVLIRVCGVNEKVGSKMGSSGC